MSATTKQAISLKTLFGSAPSSRLSFPVNEYKKRVMFLRRINKPETTVMGADVPDGIVQYSEGKREETPQEKAFKDLMWHVKHGIPWVQRLSLIAIDEETKRFWKGDGWKE